MEFIGRIEADKILSRNEDKIIVFGAGKEIGTLLKKLEKIHVKDRIVCICDNDVGRQGKEVDNIMIYSLEYAMTQYPEALYMVYNRFCIEICKQLQEKGVNKIHLIRG